MKFLREFCRWLYRNEVKELVRRRDGDTGNEAEWMQAIR